MLAVGPAAPDEAPRLLELREQAAGWLQDKGVRQWLPGEVSLDEICQQVVDGQWFVLRRAGTLVAGLRLLAADEPAWRLQPANAAYLHGLVVDRRHAGEELGAALLSWAERHAHAAGLSYLRLDCLASNTTLRGYYAAAGFTDAGYRDFDSPRRTLARLEKRRA